jgi:hypothetical protein
VATLEFDNAQRRASWDLWPLLGAVDRGTFFSVGNPGTVTSTNGFGGTAYAGGGNGMDYNVSSLANWTGQNAWAGSWFLNSLINANPEPPVGP